ncbi:MAG: 16S rRNA (guanine(527)-N(7))-methyltransferase RsmG [Bacilli bacterium]|nr:16S rRNA (guanine(527)-N(7))-methyltransferase RsmG [Bacilli bacterium]
MTEEIFIKYLEELNVEVTPYKLEQLNRYYCLLVEWNKKINLTSITEKEDVYLKHFYDSLTLNKAINLNEITNLCDIGTGAGFPGLVIKIMFPHLKVTLLDSLNKRTEFLKIVIKELGLKEIEVINSRAEEYKERERFEVVTARAVAPLNILLELATPISANYIVLMKANCEEELKNTKNLYKELALELKIKEEFYLPFENSKRTILKYEKKSKTNLKYPRRYDQIKKKPL